MSVISINEINDNNKFDIDIALLNSLFEPDNITDHISF